MIQEDKEINEKELVKKEKKIIWTIVFLALLVAVTIVSGGTYLTMK